MNNNFLEEIKWRGLIFQNTPNIEKVFNRTTTIYLGIDATADSLHIGHLAVYLALKRAYDAGHNIIILTATGTAMVGDPSGRDAERPILSVEVLNKNKEKLTRQFEKLFPIDNKRVKIVDNAAWLTKLSLIEFLRDVGKHISVNSMMDKESVKNRITRAEGISYAEFSYQLLQAYDFLRFYEDYNCEVQFGGSDQWGNMIQGVELIRKKIGHEAHVLSLPLIVNPKTGKKFGKTESGESIWLDSEKTSPFAFYQFIINVDDSLAPHLMRYYSFISKEEAEELEKEWEANKANRLLQKELAYELTVMIHGRETADQAKKITEILFSTNLSKLSEQDLEFIKKALPYKAIAKKEDLILESILPEIGLVASKSEARRLIEQNGVKVENIGKYFLIRRGKKDYGLVEVI